MKKYVLHPSKVVQKAVVQMQNVVVPLKKRVAVVVEDQWKKVQ